MRWIKVRTALCSVTDKSGLEGLARCLASLDCRIISSGGTATFLDDRGIPVELISRVTGFPEILNGRVKTLHPKVHGGLLAVRGNAEHDRQLQAHGIAPIDMVIVNLYPFVETVSRKERTVGEAIENIDIGGPAMIRSAAKNFEAVAAVTDPADYAGIVEELQENGGALSLPTRLRLAQKAFARTADYDRHVSNFLNKLSADSGEILEAKEEKPYATELDLDLHKVWHLRYGENPHQQAAFYRDSRQAPWGLARATLLQGKEISYNNLLDLDAAVCLVAEFREPATVIIKHTNPCGAACGDDILSAYQKAYNADPLSAFGSVVAFNREVGTESARMISEHFVEALVAPAYSDGALEIFQARENLRLLRLPDFVECAQRWRSVSGGILLQDADRSSEDRQGYQVVSKRRPTAAEWEDMLFAWKVVKHVKSNAIVLASDHATTGVGAGQMSRVESVDIAVRKAGARSKGSVLASDAFFPFRDGVDTAARAGVVAAIQPGGSRRDAEVIAAADEHGMVMVFTGVRHFRH